MTTSHEIKFIKKSERMNIHERIVHIGGPNPDGHQWELTRSEAINGIEKGFWHFYVTDGNQKIDVVVSKNAAGYKHLKTKVDGKNSNLLVALPENL